VHDACMNVAARKISPAGGGWEKTPACWLGDRRPVIACVMAGLLTAALPSCGIPVSVGYETPEGRISYSAKRGLAVDWRASK